MKAVFGCPERTEEPATLSPRMMHGAPAARRSGSRCLELFVLLLLGSCCHMLHGQAVQGVRRARQDSETHQRTLTTLETAVPLEVAPYLRGMGRGQHQVVLEGNRLMLTCLAGGSWPLQYRWTLNNSNITDWSPQYRLSIDSIKRSDTGLYQCLVRNRMGAVIHWKTEVQVAFLGNYSTEEQRKTVTQGRATVLSAPPLASYPQPVVTWYKDGHKIIPNNRLCLFNVQSQGCPNGNSGDFFSLLSKLYLGRCGLL